MNKNLIKAMTLVTAGTAIAGCSSQQKSKQPNIFI
jgi:outer membrane murein-binding lipoprotein Lpp